jgi:D-glycero-D-manno-heptose 1,7-bisphosphate phosphatase
VRTGRAAKLSDAEVAQAAAGIDRVQVHASLAAFAEFMLHREHAAAGVVGEDSGPMPLAS